MPRRPFWFGNLLDQHYNSFSCVIWSIHSSQRLRMSLHFLAHKVFVASNHLLNLTHYDQNYFIEYFTEKDILRLFRRKQ